MKPRPFKGITSKLNLLYNKIRGFKFKATDIKQIILYGNDLLYKITTNGWHQLILEDRAVNREACIRVDGIVFIRRVRSVGKAIRMISKVGGL